MNPPQAQSQPATGRGSIRTQLVAGSIGVLLMLLIVIGLIVRYTVATTLMTSVDRDLDRQVRPWIQPPPPPPLPPDSGFQQPRFGGNNYLPGDREPPPPPPFDGPPPRQPFGRAGLNHSSPPEGDLFRQRRFSASGSSLEFNPLKPFDPAALLRAEASGIGTSIYTDVQYQDQSVRVLTHVYSHHGAKQLIQAAYPLREVNRAIHGVDLALLLLAPVAVLGAWLGGWWLTGRALHPVRQITRAAAQISAEDLSRRLPASGSDDEFGELGRTFNALLARVDAAFRKQSQLMEQQRRFTADASHELKTPLTVIRGTTSLALSQGPDAGLDHESVVEIDRAAESMASLVQDLLYLARADAGQLARAQADLPIAELIRRAVARVAPVSPASIGISLSDQPLLVHGSDGDLTRLFANLLENAARHTPKTGAITIAARPESGAVIVTVADTGSGIAPEHLPHLFERFYRVDTSRTRQEGKGEVGGGAGLGLAICKSIVEAHGGKIKIESRVGQGTLVTVTLPTPSACGTFP